MHKNNNSDIFILNIKENGIYLQLSSYMENCQQDARNLIFLISDVIVSPSLSLSLDQNYISKCKRANAFYESVASDSIPGKVD